MSNKIHSLLKGFLLFGILSFLFLGCKKEKTNFTNPYAGGKQSLGIKFSTSLPEPEMGEPGSLVTFKTTGLLPYKDSLSMFMNGERAEIVHLDSNSVQVKVPETASTGIASIQVGDQIFFGPIFKVEGKLMMDSTFEATVGANRSISDYLRLPDGRIILVGNFSDFNHEGSVKRINRIVMISKDGKVDPSLNTGEGVIGSLNTIATLPKGKIVVGGSFSSFDTHVGEINNITVLNSDGSPDTMVIRTFQSKDTVPTFNGGTDGRISKVFVHDGMITAVGNFEYYLQYVYGESDYRKQRDSLIIDSVRVRNIIRLFPDGSLDSSFNYDFFEHRSLEGPNGPVHDAYMQDNGKLILVGSFSRYNGENVNNIVRLNTDGSIDRSFKVGNGADDPITSIQYNEVSHQFLLAGSFHRFNREPHSGLVILGEEGSVVESFKAASMEPTGVYYFAQQLSNGLIIVNGHFKTYNKIQRGNFMVLDEKGKLAAGYNNTGKFHGSIHNALETTNLRGDVLVMLMGSFNKFDEQDLGNITRLLFEK